MNFYNIALKNIKKNIKFYLLYLISISIIITVFFSFSSFSKNYVMINAMSQNGRVEQMCSTVSIFLCAFVIFYMLHSNKFFLKRRIKELGIYTLLGYQKKTITILLILENALISIFSLIVGILMGGIFHKLIVVFIVRILDLSVDTSRIEFLNIRALSQTVIFVLMIILVLSISNAKFIYKSTLMDLIRYEKKAEKNVKFNRFFAMVGCIFLLVGYIIMFDIIRGKNSVWMTIGFYPMLFLTMICIIIGSIFFIRTFLPYIFNKLKGNKKLFYKERNIIVIPNFIYRIRSNSKTLIMLTMLSAATLVVVAVMALTMYYPIFAVERICPSEYEFVVENKEQIDKAKDIIKNYSNDDINYTETNIYRAVSKDDNLPKEYYLGTNKAKRKNSNVVREEGFECVSYSSYKELLSSQKRDIKIDKLENNQVVLVRYENEKDDNFKKEISISIGDVNRNVVIQDTTLDNVIAFANTPSCLIISDELYNEISANEKPFKTICDVNGKGISKNEKLYNELNVMLDKNPCFQSFSHRVHEIIYNNSPTFLLITFLVVLFFIATGSILYFNNISFAMDSKDDYDILYKMGYSKGDIRKITNKQVTIFYVIPYILGMLDCIGAVMVFKKMLMQNLLEDSIIQYMPVIVAIIIASIIYLIYYIATIVRINKFLDSY